MPLRIKHIHLFYLINLFVCCKAIWAQEPFLYHYSTKDGLGSREVHHIFQDSKGLMWFSTDGGVTRYDANTFKNFTAYNGLPDNTVFEIMEDKTGRLWYRTFTGGIGYIFNDTVVSVKANKKIIEFQGSGILQSFAIDDNGSVWLGRAATDGCFFVKVDPPYNEQNVTKVVSKNVERNGIDALIINNRVVFADNRNFVATPSNYIVPYELYITYNNKVVIADTFPSIETNSLVKMFFNDGEVIYGSGKYLRKYDLQTRKKLIKIVDDQIITWLIDDKKLLLGSRINGVKEYGSFSAQVECNYLKHHSITAVKKDLNGGYWFGTLENGVYYCPDKNYNRIRILKIESEKTEINAFTKLSDTSLLIGTKSGNVYMLRLSDGRTSENLVYTNGDDGSVLGFIKLNGSKLLICNSSVLSSSLFDVSGKLKFLNKVTRYKFFCKAGKYYAGHNIKSVYLIDTGSFEKVKVFEFQERINSIAHDPLQNILYVAGVHGLHKLNVLKDKFEKTGPECRIDNLLCDKEYLFMATKSNGLIIKKDETYDTISVKEGLLSNICRKVFLNKDEIWLITYSGLSRIKYKGYKHYTITNYAFADHVFPEGLEEIEFIGDSLVFFDKNDLCFFPLSKKEVLHQPFSIKSILVNGIELPRSKDLNLEYYQNNVQVDFAALFYSNNNVVLYRYKFTGDTNWVYSTKSNLNFPSLSSGTYLLKLQARNYNGEWIDCESALTISISKPFWVRWWFISLITLLLVSLIALSIYSRYIKAISKERKKNEMQKRMYDLEMQAVKAQMNPHFIFNALNTLQRYILEEDTDNAHDYLTKFSRLLRKMLESSTTESIVLAEEVEILRNYIEIEKLRFKGLFNYEIINSIDNFENVKIPFMLIQPFVENAIWHGLMPKQGERYLKINFSELDAHRILCFIEDNGVGRGFKAKEENTLKKKSLATEFIKQRLDLLEKIMGIECGMQIIDKKDDSGNSLGTKVEIVIPKIK